MPAIAASAPGKAILFGEHAVVYGQPAIAVPLSQISARATVKPDIRGERGAVTIHAPDIDLQGPLKDLPLDHALHQAVQLTLDALSIDSPPAFTLAVTSTIPLAAGLGSGAAVSVAVIRAVSAFLGHPLPDEQVNALAHEIEKIHHGTPSGIDNTVVTYAQPVYFVREQPIETFTVATPFTLVIADTGVPSPTAITVGDVRAGWQADPERYDALFTACGLLAVQARTMIERGDPAALGPLMNENHALLTEMGVSSAELDQLVTAARDAGALGAKLSGGGRGGNMLALVDEHQAESVDTALRKAGATNTLVTEVGAH